MLLRARWPRLIIKDGRHVLAILAGRTSFCGTPRIPYVSGARHIAGRSVPLSNSTVYYLLTERANFVLEFSVMCERIEKHEPPGEVSRRVP